jgi:hypothetical protein
MLLVRLRMITGLSFTFDLVTTARSRHEVSPTD